MFWMRNKKINIFWYALLSKVLNKARFSHFEAHFVEYKCFTFNLILVGDSVLSPKVLTLE